LVWPVNDKAASINGFIEQVSALLHRRLLSIREDSFRGCSSLLRRHAFLPLWRHGAVIVDVSHGRA
jgi:hypothetical protein